MVYCCRSLTAGVCALIKNNILLIMFQTLSSHFLPAVSKLVNKLLTPETVFSDIELDLGKYLDIDDDQVSHLHASDCMCDDRSSVLCKSS